MRIVSVMSADSGTNPFRVNKKSWRVPISIEGYGISTELKRFLDGQTNGVPGAHSVMQYDRRDDFLYVVTTTDVKSLSAAKAVTATFVDHVNRTWNRLTNDKRFEHLGIESTIDKDAFAAPSSQATYGLVDGDHAFRSYDT